MNPTLYYSKLHCYHIESHCYDSHNNTLNKSINNNFTTKDQDLWQKNVSMGNYLNGNINKATLLYHIATRI
jgi:hypothetical protein